MVEYTYYSDPLRKLSLYQGITTADGAGDGSTLVCSDLVNQDEDYNGNHVIITSGTYRNARDINGTTLTGTVTFTSALKGQIVKGTTFMILGFRTTPAEVAALQADVTAILADTNELQTDWVNGGRLDLILDAIKTLADALDLTSFKQETAGATAVDGTTWKDLLDKSTITKPTKICGFTVTVAGSWAGNAKIRITEGAGNKIFPFQDEYVQGTDFTSGTQYTLNFPIVVPVADGYKFQFRSSAADGAGDTLQLNNLDIIETG